MNEEPERAKTVIERHDDRPLRGKVLAVVPLLTAGTAREAATIYPDHHRPAIARRLRARPDVEVQAILAARRFPRSRLCRRSRRRGGAARASARPTASSARTVRARCAKGVAVA